MKCPYCKSEDLKVIDSRDVNDGVRRRRQCLSCNSRFTTYEKILPSNLFVIKKDMRREEFSKEKLLSGIQKACGKRPLPIGAIEKLANLKDKGILTDAEYRAKKEELLARL
mgnify:CR=1 FL=1